MSSYMDKTFCGSPNCTNKCGRQMTHQERAKMSSVDKMYVSYTYFCGEPEQVAITDDYALEREKHESI